MGTLEDVQEKDRVTQRALLMVREVQKNDAHRPSVDTALGVHNRVSDALAAVRDEMVLLRQVAKKLEEMDEEVKLRLEERQNLLQRRAEYFKAPGAAEAYTRSSDELRRFYPHVVSEPAAPEPPTLLHYIPPDPPWRTLHPKEECDICAEEDRGSVVPHTAFKRRPIQETRYAAPSPPDNERYEEWRRKNGG